MTKDGRKVATMVKLAPTERAQVERTAQREGISISAVVRRAIKCDKAIHDAATSPEAK